MAAGDSANDAFLDALTAAVDTLDTYVARVNAGAVIAAGDNTTFKIQGLNGPAVAGATRTVKLLGRVGSEDHTFLDALNAIADTFGVYRTRVNASAAITGGDTTCYKVQDVNGAAVAGATVFYRSTSRFDTDLDDLETQINGMVEAMSQFVSAWNLKQGGTPTTLVVSTVRRLRPFSRPADSVEDTTRNIAIDGGNNQSAAVVTQPTTAFTVVVTDGSGAVVEGESVTWATSTGGSITTASLTNASGIATATPTTGELAQTETYTATTSTGQSVSFTLTATAGTAANITAASTQDQSALTSTNVATPPSALITDAYGNAKSGTTVTFAVTAGGGSRNPATVVSGSDGLSTLTSWTLGAGAGLNTLTATAAGLTGSPVTFNANAVAAAPTQIAVQSGGAQTGVTAGSAATATVFRVRDAGSSPVQDVTVAFTVTSGNGSLSVASAVTDVNGDASVTYTTDELVETATIKGAFTNASGTEVSASTTIASTFGAKSKLAIQTQPSSNGSSGTALSQQPIILIQDANGNTVTNATDTITASVQTGNAVLTAGSTKAAVAGVTTFTGMTLTDTDSGANTIRFSSGALTVVDSSDVTLAPPVPVALQFSGPISGVVEDTGILTFSVLVVDSNNTIVPGATNAVTVALTSAGGATLGGDLTVNAVAGVASWSATEAVTVDTAGTYTLTATATGLTSAVSGSFTISALGSGAHPNEPAGMTPLTDQPWDALPAVGSTVNALGWRRNVTGTQQITVDTTGPLSPQNVLTISFNQNLSGGTAPVNIECPISGTARKRLYVHCPIFLPTNWTNSGNSGTKFFFVAQHSNKNHLVDLVRGSTGTGNMFSMITQHNDAPSSGQTLSGGFNGTTANRNRWLDVELECVANTPGTSNGIYRVWLDGVLKITHTNVLYFLAGQTPYFNMVKVNPTFGGGSGQPPTGGLQLKVDHIYASVANS